MMRVPALDGIRGIAILLVLVGHGFSGFVGHTLGQDGVRLFFVLSGFLITHQLLEARSSQASRGEQLRMFYARRFFRLFPIYYLFLIVATLLNFGGARSFDALYLWTYTYNMTVAGIDAAMAHGVSHLWSLCVEEQFYLVWPWLVVWVASRKRLWWTTLAVVVASLALRLWLLYDDHWRADYVLMPTNADALGIGALMAIRRPSV